MKRAGVFLFVILSLFLVSCSVKKTMLEPVSFRAVLLSDLHFTVDPEVVSSVVPAMPYSPAFTDALLSEVIARKPDVLIITGDNTNSGALSDMEALAQRLKRVREAGIPIVMTTGNHDFNRSTETEYETVYGPLLNMESRAPDSLSYRTDISGVRLLAMDDSAVDQGATGTFSKATMSWLKQELNTAREEGIRTVFLSHHNVLAGQNDERNVTYRITNRELVPMLEKYGVRLCITGHLHSEMILQEKGVHEIILGMPLSGTHDIGVLEINGNQVVYRAEPADLETYGETGLAEAIRETDRESDGRFQEIFTSLLEKQDIRGEQKEGILRLTGEFMHSHGAGTLEQDADAIRNDPYYEAMIDALWDYNYGPWIKNTIENPPADARNLSFGWEN